MSGCLRMTNDKININNEKREFLDGKSCCAYKLLGSVSRGGSTEFRVWAPNADRCFVSSGGKKIEMQRDGGFFHIKTSADFSKGYRYLIEKNGDIFEKNDPFAFSVNGERLSEVVSVDGIKPDIWRKNCGVMRIFEVHAGAGFDFLSKTLPSYIKKLGFTHAELMPVFSHPCVESWGYQATGYFSFEYGSPQSFAALVRAFHEEGMGVIIDLPLGHFANDFYGLGRFDGTPLFESADETVSQNRLWGTVNTDFGKPAARSLMLSSACFLADVFGIDGIRVDAAANMIFDRFDGYGSFGGADDINISALEFLRALTNEMRKRNVITIAEDSSTVISSTAPAALGGLGFDRKQNLGWYHDTSVYFSAPPYVRGTLGDYILKPFSYMNGENYLLPVSHDENSHGKGTLASRLKDEKNQKLMLFYMYASKGDKLLFDGCERGAVSEWNPGAEGRGETPGIAGFVSKLNRVCDELAPLSGECGEPNFSEGVLTFSRFGTGEDDFVIAAVNTSDTDFEDFRIGVDRFTDFRTVISTDESLEGLVYKPMAFSAGGHMFSVSVKLPALSGVLLKPDFIWKNKI